MERAGAPHNVSRVHGARGDLDKNLAARGRGDWGVLSDAQVGSGLAGVECRELHLRLNQPGCHQSAVDWHTCSGSDERAEGSAAAGAGRSNAQGSAAVSRLRRPPVSSARPCDSSALICLRTERVGAVGREHRPRGVVRLAEKRGSEFSHIHIFFTRLAARMEPRRHAGGHKHAALWQRLSLLALLVGTAQGLTIKPGTANSFTNETITFTADVPVRWNVVPRQGRPNFQVVMQNLQQIRIRAGNIGACSSTRIVDSANLNFDAEYARHVLIPRSHAEGEFRHFQPLGVSRLLLALGTVTTVASLSRN